MGHNLSPPARVQGGGKTARQRASQPGRSLDVEGSQSRLADLYRIHAPSARRLAYLMTGDRDLAEDITQDAFIKLAGRWRDLRSQDAFGAYLRRTVVNLSRGHWRHVRVERKYLEREGTKPQHLDSPEFERGDDLWQLLQALPHRQRAAIVLRYYEDLSEQQTADALNCSTGAVKALTHRGIERLRGQLKGDDA
jgi:RNA polymerase sigma-70 factor (sigma-E family)